MDINHHLHHQTIINTNITHIDYPNTVKCVVVSLDPTCVDSPYRSSDQQKILPGHVSESEHSLDSSTLHQVHLQGC